MRHKIYIIIICIIFAAVAAVFLFFPRSKVSALEKRELATFPDYSQEKLQSGEFAKEISSWFSDSEPYRDELMAISMEVRDAIRLKTGGEEAVTVHAAPASLADTEIEKPGADATAAEIEAYENHLNADQNARIVGSAGIIVVGSGPSTRALMAYGGRGGGDAYAQAVSEYAAQLPGVKVWSMVVPLASEFYTPDKVKRATQPQLPTIRNIYSKLTNGARGVDVYTPLAQHAAEDIYLRTDHHWAPLGAYYAAQAFAKAAGVPFKSLDAYDKHIVHRFVGSMYGYSKDISIKNNPEEFVFYTPNGINYSTTYVNYNVNKGFRISGESKPYEGPFFYKFKDGNGNAYCTFMGSDMKLTKVKTGTNSPRRLLIIKDSYGNAIPGYLFYSFGEVHVVDFRYFNRNIKSYIQANHITDVLFATNIFNAYASSTKGKVLKFLTQANGVIEKESEPAPIVDHKPEKTKEKNPKSITTPESTPEIIQPEPSGEPAAPSTPQTEE